MLYKLGIGLTVVILIAVLGCVVIDQLMRWSTQDQVYTDLNKIPPRPVALVLGTSKYVGKRLNPFYMNRLDRAVALYRHGKVTRFIVSGDKASRYYNEPRTMLNDLVKKGVPRRIIQIDNQGYRTIDSIFRAKSVFGESHIIIISQRFHLTRALFIANYFNMDCIGLIADDAPFIYYWRTRIREVGARVLAVFELYILPPAKQLA
ncbi:vancomycin high temperature exclusion protein [Celerinatantimonas sp. YJH-8]|uniref:SanA/YdcF family protein n=1 Tax=Celerinatantimonas sp. YJH-8 TaxID=3228714 RepID=UPI0038CAAD8B